MNTITLPPDVAQPLEREAESRGVSPEALAVEILRQRLSAAPPPPVNGGSLYDYLKEHIGTISGAPDSSQHCGDQFTDILLEKQRRGRL
jgi:hypothetical protein